MNTWLKQSHQGYLDVEVENRPIQRKGNGSKTKRRKNNEQHMNIKIFLKSLSAKELEQVKKYLKDHPNENGIIIKEKLTIKDVIRENPQISIRLFTSLELYAKKYPYVKDLLRSRFLETRNTGARSWDELSELLSTKYGINGN